MRHLLRLAALLVLLARGSCNAPWLYAESSSRAWRRTREEATAFDAACRNTAAAAQWASADAARASHARVLVFDVRHGFWVGLGDSMSRVNALLRAGRSTGRATYLWADGCADRDGPRRMVTTARANGTECFFDVGRWFHTVGALDWRWSLRKRRLVQSRHVQETALAFSCVHMGPRACEHTRLVDSQGRTAYEDRGPSRVLRHLAEHPAAWLRVELASVDDMRDVGDALPRDDRCETFMNTRPSPELWGALGAHLARADEWRGFVALAVRTGYADHVDLFPELSGAAPEPVSSLERLFQPCGADVAPVTRFAAPGQAACVKYQTHADSEPFVPDETAVRRCGAADDAWFDGSPLGPLRAYVACAAASARATAAAAGAPDAWGVLVVSDSPAVRRAASAWLGEGRTMTVTSPPGHVQYTPDPGVACAAAADFYLAGLADDAVRVFASYFIDTARARRFGPSRAAPGASLDYAWPHWFEAGNERAMGRDKVALDVMRTLV